MVRRPLFFAAVSFSCAILICSYMSIAAGCVVSLALGCLWAVRHKGIYNRQVLIVTVFFFVSLFNYILYDCTCNFYDEYTGQNVSIEGCADKIQYKKNPKGEMYLQVTLDAEKINGQDCRGGIMERREKLLVTCYDENIEQGNITPGSIVSVKGVMEEPSGKRNPNCFNYGLYLESLGIGNIIKTEKVEVLEHGKTFGSRLYVIKNEFTDRLESIAGNETSGMVKGIMFGDKTDIEADVLEEFQRSGTAHILAVSGLHIGIIYGFISKIWRWKKGKIYFAAVILFFMCYCIWSSFSPSVIRAVFMTELHLIAVLTKSRYDLSSAAFLIYLIMLLKNPMELFNVGFQMSFIAVLTLAAVIPYINRFYTGIFAGSLAVQTGLVPYTMYVFNYFAPAAFIVNVPVIFLTGIIVPLGLMAFAASFLCDPVFKLLSEILGGLCYMLQEFNSFTCIEGVTSFDVTSPGRIFLAMYYLGMMLFLSEEGRLMIIRRKTDILKVMVLFCVAVSLVFGSVTKSGFEKVDIIFVDVGQGDCIHLKTKEGGNYFIDGGGSTDYSVGEKTLKPYLLKNGVRKLDGALVTHLHTDHYKGIAELCREGMVEKLFLYEGNKVKEEEIVRDTGMHREDIVYLKKGQNLTLGDNVKAEVLWPEGRSNRVYENFMINESDENESSLIFKVNIDGIDLLVTGDIDSDCEKELAGIYGNRLDADILKVAHHGSRYSYDVKFAEYVSPQYAVFQVGKNNYGHPNSEVVDKYREKKAQIYRCDEDGAVGFCINDGVKVVTVLR